MADTEPKTARLWWLDGVKAAALVWIFMNHVAEEIFGPELWTNPAPGQPPLADRIRQFKPVGGFGIWTPLANVVRWVGWSGDQGVTVFLIASGFGLAYALVRSGAGPTVGARDFYRRRLSRILPLWWVAHAGLLLASIALGRATPSMGDGEFWLSLLGVRFWGRGMYYGSAAWWYVGLLLQLYLVFPWLWRALCRLGPARFLAAASVVTIAFRLAGLLTLHGYLDAWSRGAFFPARLAEFALGMALAVWYGEDPGRLRAALTRGRTMVAALAVYAVGAAAGFTLIGMAVAPALLGAAAFALIGAACVRLEPVRIVRSVGSWLSEHSLAIFLVHVPIVIALVGTATFGGVQAVRIGVAAVVSVIAALALERATTIARRVKPAPIAAAVAVFVVVSVAAEIVSRHLDPWEHDGWGERPSLVANAEFGWTLEPSSTTHLRWNSYDYTARANARGFPSDGPYSEAAGLVPATIVTGDAFTSGEGVGTDKAWPRLFVAIANTPVLNFAVTGYGPSQEARVLAKYVPQLHPETVIVQLFVNDFEDEDTTDAEFRDQIGVSQRSPSGLGSILGLSNLKAVIRQRVVEPAKAKLKGDLDPNEYFIRGLRWMEPGYVSKQAPAYAKVVRDLGRMKAVADSVGARFVVVTVPAPAQVCGTVPAGYDKNGAEDLLVAAAHDAGVAAGDVHSLRPMLEALKDCPYQPHNLHWTAAGHRAVALEVAGYLTGP